MSDGLTEDIINRLAQSPELRVLARTSVFRYKNKDEDPQKIGKELQVQGVLTGRITRRGDEVAVETDLVNVSDGSQIWGQRYTRKISDVAALQNEIASDLSARLRTQVTHQEKELMTMGTTAKSEAYQLYLKGRFYWNQRTKENLRRSIDCFQQAISLDPNYAMAYVGLADAYAVSSGYGAFETKEAAPLAEAAKRALELAPNLGTAHAAMGSVNAEHRDWAGANREFQLAITLDPKDARSHYFLRLYRANAPIAIRGSRPGDATSARSGARITYHQRQLWRPSDDGKTLCRSQSATRSRSGNGAKFHYCARPFARVVRDSGPIRKCAPDSHSPIPAIPQGKEQPTKEEYWRGLIEVARLRSESMGEGFTERIWTQLGDHEKAFAWLEKSAARGDDLLPNFMRSPIMDPLHGDPRYAAVLHKLNLAP